MNHKEFLTATKPLIAHSVLLSIYLALIVTVPLGSDIINISTCVLLVMTMLIVAIWAYQIKLFKKWDKQ